GYHRGDAAHDRVGAAEDSAVTPAVADSDHEFRIRRRLPSPPECLRQRARHRARHQETIGMARRGDEVHAEPFQVVVRPGEPGDLELAAVAGARVDLPDRERATKEMRDLRGEACADALELAAASGRLGDDARANRGSELSEHGSAPGWPAHLLTELPGHRPGPR